MKMGSVFHKNWRLLSFAVIAAPLLAVLLMGCPQPSPVAITQPGETGLIQVPLNPAPYLLAVDGDPMTMNADLGTGNWDWYRFDAEAGQKYYIYASGNAPVNVMLFKGVDTEAKGQMAIMLWTTDPVEPDFYYWEHPNVHDDHDITGMKTASKAIAIPSFVAAETTTYYVVVQAARMLECLPNCKDDEVALAAYYDVRTYNIQVGTVADSADANALTIYNPATDEAPYLKGEVKVNKHDWFYFDATDDTSYMIEFLEPAASRGHVTALVYSPLGDITCEVVDCDSCLPQPLYAPYAGRYYILVSLVGEPSASGHVDLTADQEFFGSEYLLRVFADDHGNLPALATPIDTPALNAESAVAGYLTRGDEDWFDFDAAPYSTYWVETRGDFDLRLNVSGNTEDEPLDDVALGLAAFLQREVDGRNDMAIFQTARMEETIPFSVKMVQKPLNPFKLDMGAYSVAVIGDDHVDAHLANTANAAAVAVNGSGQGVLWQTDTDMLTFTAPREHFLYQVQSEGANLLEVWTINGGATGFDVEAADAWPVDSLQPKSLVAYYDNQDPDTAVYVVASGVDENVLETAFTVAVAEDDHRNATGDFAADAAAATTIDVAAGGSGVLWPGDSDVFLLNITAAQAGRQLEVTVTANGAEDNVIASWWPEGGALADQNDTFWAAVPTEGEYLIAVRHAGVDAEASVSYTIALRLEPGINPTGNFVDDMAAAPQITLGGNSGEQELWPGDTDVYRLALSQPDINSINDLAEPKLLRVRLTGTGGAPLYLRWWESDGTVVDYTKDFTIKPTEDGDYGIVVLGSNTEIVSYTVETSIIPEPIP